MKFNKKVQLDLFQSLFSHNFLWLAAFFCCACVFPTKSWTKTTTKVLKVYPTWNHNSKSTWKWMVGRRSFPFGMASWQLVSGSVTKSTCDFFLVRILSQIVMLVNGESVSVFQNATILRILRVLRRFGIENLKSFRQWGVCVCVDKPHQLCFWIENLSYPKKHRTTTNCRG